MKNLEKGKLPFWIKLGYGGLEGGTSSAWNLVYIFFLYFLTDAVGINPALAGSVLMIATLWDAFTDPAIGIISDNLKLKWGRRRPFLLIAALPFGITVWLLFTDFHLGFAYHVAMVILFFTFFTMANVPYQALGAEMTQDYNERMSLVTFRSWWMQIFTLVSASLPLVFVDIFGKALGNMSAGWSAMAAMFGAMSVLLILLTWRTTRGYELFPESTGFRFRDIYDVIRQNRTFRYTLGVWVFSIVALNFVVSTAIYFFTYVMGFGESMMGMAFGVLIAASLIYLPIIDYVARKKGKRIAFIVFATFWGVLSLVFVLTIAGPQDSTIFWISLVTGGAVSACMVYMLGWAMIPDITEVDELMSGQRREGLYFGVMAFIQKIASAVTLQLIGLILAWVGYQPDIAQTSEAIWGIRILMYAAPVVFLIPAIIIAYYLPMTREKHQALCDILKLKKENKEYDITPIKDLF
ncbi:MAG: hypothetical protein DRH90_15625 [Deltaproteobacteria bacterium]|nr:MAG: hypothetical protein DRH90_15625 [Deltaproteobacteria bacterium]